MSVISISLGKDGIRQLEKAQRECGVRGRSRLMRMGIESLLKEYSSLDGLTGEHTAVFTITHERRDHGLDHMLHEFSESVRMSTHLDSKRGCAEIIVLECGADRIRQLFHRLKNSKDVRSVNFAIA